MPGQRWQAHELEALQWLCERRKQSLIEAMSRGKKRGGDKWSWIVIAKKMNRVAKRDEWERLRFYTALNCYTAMRKRETLLQGPRQNVLEHPQPLSGPVENPDQQQPLGHGLSAASARSAQNPDQQEALYQVENRADPVAVQPAQPKTSSKPNSRRSPREDRRVTSNLPNNNIPAPPYHWTPAERDALKDVYLFSGIGSAENYMPGRRRGLWSWKMVASEMNIRATGAPWDVARTYTDSSCHQKAKYYRDEWNDPRNLRPVGASCAPIDEG